jgi:uncharacterized membrane protein YphA (DoxX/SURF4 family)
MERTRSRWRTRIGWAIIAVVTALEVLSMGDAGLSKFQSMDGWMYWFARFGYPPRMALLIGAIEFVGAGLLLIPRLASYSSIVLAVVMLGALEAVLTTETDLGWFDPVLHLAFLTIIGSFHWKRRWPRIGPWKASSPTTKNA